MGKNIDNPNDRQKTVTALCVVVSYIIMYGLLMLFMSVLENSTPAFLVFLVISFIFAYKSCKGSLHNNLSNLPWPVFLVLLVILSAVIGCFTAPYHIGMWIAKKINNSVSFESSSNASTTSYTEESLRKMSLKELDELYLDLTHIVMPTYSEPESKKIPYGTKAYGCKTWGEARAFMDLVAKIHNEKLPKKVNTSKSSGTVESSKRTETKANLEVITNSEKEQLLKSGGEERLNATINALDLANKGKADAMILLGITYQSVIKNPEKTAYWFQKASSTGSADGLYWYGECFASGYGVPMDKTKGMNMIFDAARKGSKEAVQSLLDSGVTLAQMRSVGIDI